MAVRWRRRGRAGLGVIAACAFSAALYSLWGQRTSPGDISTERPELTARYARGSARRPRSRSRHRRRSTNTSLRRARTIARSGGPARGSDRSHGGRVSCRNIRRGRTSCSAGDAPIVRRSSSIRRNRCRMIRHRGSDRDACSRRSRRQSVPRVKCLGRAPRGRRAVLVRVR